MPISALQAAVRAAASGEALPPRMAAQVAAVLERKLALYVRAPDWCVPELPRRIARHLGAPPEVSDGLAVSALLYHCAADVVDDAQDGELEALPGWPGGGWTEAVTVGLYLLSAHGAHLASLAAPADVRAAWASLFGRAGMVLTIGQHADLALHPDAPLDEEAVLALGGRKAGGALAGLVSLGPVWAGREDLAAWWTLGTRLGRLFQVASDVEAYVRRGAHPDLAAAKLTLPLLVARDLEPGLADLWQAGLPLGAEDQARLRAGVQATGALDYVQLRLGALRAEVESLVVDLGGEALRAELAPILRTAQVVVEPVPV